MELALTFAKAAGERGEVPIGAVIVRDGEVVSAAGNRTRELRDPTAHAEILAIREACEKEGRHRLDGADLYVTLEPCAMCAGAISEARIRRVSYGAEDRKGGALDNGPRLFASATTRHRPEVVGGIDEIRCSLLLKGFFHNLRTCS